MAHSVNQTLQILKIISVDQYEELDEAGFTIRKKIKSSKRHRWTKERKTALQKDIDKGMSIDKAAAKYETSRGRIYQLINGISA